MGNPRGGKLRSTIWRALAGMAVSAQVLMLFSPLVELRDSDARGPRLAAGFATPGIATIGSERSHAPPHNATTCPACIAQSLHARVEPGVRLPAAIVAEGAPIDLRITVLPHHDPPSTHLSRAPPSVS